VAAVLAEAIVIYLIAPLDNAGERLTWYLLPAAHLLLVPFLLRNRSFWGLRFVLVGLLLNVAVMAANGGLMPVDEGAVAAVGRHEAGQLVMDARIPRTKNVLLARDETQLSVLSDSILLPLPKPFTKAISIGDVFIGIGLILTGGELILRNRWGGWHFLGSSSR
jgi:hypothetical protein